jgi:hypothetical protein
LKNVTIFVNPAPHGLRSRKDWTIIVASALIPLVNATFQNSHKMHSEGTGRFPSKKYTYPINQRYPYQTKEQEEK